MCKSAKAKSQLALFHDDDEDVFATGLVNRYVARPDMLQDMCLATFAVTFDVASNYRGEMNVCDDEVTNGVGSANGSSSNNDASNLDKGKHASEKIRLKNNLEYMRKRRQEAILCTRRHKVNVESEKY